MSTLTGTVGVDLTDPELYRRGFPHELFTELRAEGAVLHHPAVPMANAPDGVPFWVVLRHEEVVQANRDWETFSATRGPAITGQEDERSGHMLVAADPPTHTRLRKLISAGFTPRMISRLDDRIAMWSRRIVDDVLARGECDFVRDVAYPLPMHLIADIVGIPEADRPAVFANTDTALRAGDPRSGISADDHVRAQLALYEYAQALGQEKRAHPADDVWSIIANARLDDGNGNAEELSVLELDMFFVVLSIAGSETTRNTISMGMQALVEHPDQLERLRGDSGLLDTATEEMIRWSSPVTSFARSATVATELGGVPIAKGDRIAMFYPSANRDERAFEQPFRFDVGRSPNHHVSFGGGGVHFCLGAHLARREIRAMFQELLARVADVEILAEPSWMCCGPDQSVGVSIDTLPVRLTGN
ncbi:MAG: cytochrome P450 [Acidimicrobiia bacterium]